MPKSKKKNSLYIPFLTFEEIEHTITQVPALILPIGGLEPVGRDCAIGAIQECTMAISACISERCNILLNPLLSYSNTTCFRAFGGSSGVKKNIYESMIIHIAKDCAAWGVKYLFIIDGCYNSYDIVQKIIKRMEKNTAVGIKIYELHWQHDQEIQKLVHEKLHGTELGRSEFGILSMISYINPSLIRPQRQKKTRNHFLDEKTWRQWNKRGQDPERLRKLFPECTTSLIENEIDPKFGKELFEYIVMQYEKMISDVLKT